MANRLAISFLSGIIAMTSFVNSADAASADTLTYTPSTVRYAGPFTLKSPVVIDSINAKQVKFSSDKLFDTPLSLTATDGNAEQSLANLDLLKSSLNLISFDVEAKKYVKPTVKVTGAKQFKVYADGNDANGTIEMAPGQHTITVKFIADSTKIDVALNGLPASGDASAITSTDGKQTFTMAVNLGTRTISYARMSPSGKWCLVNYGWYDATNTWITKTMLVDNKTKQSTELGKGGNWMPRTDRYYYTEKEGGKTILKAVDPQTGAITVLSSDLPSETFMVSPTEDFLILTQYESGPNREDGVYEILKPDDRQPGWRSRGSLSRFDLKTGFIQPLTYSHHNIWLSDISQDGKHILFGFTSDSLTQRPTTLYSYYDLNLENLETKCLVDKDGFLASAIYAGQSNDKVLFSASTEAFHSIGNRVPKGSTPNMYDYHLYLLDTASAPQYEGIGGKVTPLTADDKTSIDDISYSPSDGFAYYVAQNGDSVSIYRLDMKTLKSQRVNQPLECVNRISIASRSGDISVCGSSACDPYKVLLLPASYTRKATASSKAIGGNWASTVLFNPNKELYKNIALGTVHPWKFTCKRGYEVSGHYYLPANFDPGKKYPVIVHYYGGCSPTSRRFGDGSHYPAHYWNALGYITFIVNPSGASGFGQEWASRHVNTMGEGVAEDIIEATEQFANDIPQVNKDKIGCVSASYGGFMTQCMMTKTDLFACGISHAGISDHTSYWGEGYWGYSYSEVSAANSYPWTRKDLYVDRSPLFNANKIHKPLLFTHGTADTNVPIGESIQMYTALKLLGIPTAFIMVEGENHGIMNPVKRAKWINSMMAWFQKYLQDDDSWWNAIYTPKEL